MSEPEQAHGLEGLGQLAGLGLWQMDCTSAQQTLTWDALCYSLHDTDVERFQPSLGSSLLLYEDESRHRLEEALLTCSLSGGSFQVEVEFLIRSGQVRRLLVAGQSQDGGRRIVGFYQDVTSRQQMQRRLLQEQSQTRALLKTLPDLLFGVDAAGVFRHYYTGQSAVLADSPEKCLGRSVAEVFPYLRQNFPVALRSVLDTGEIEKLVFQLHTQAGDGTFEVRILPLEGVDPSQRALLLIRDISEQHLREEELKRSQAAALLASRVKSQFLANMSHEIRTPLNGTIGMLELLLGTDLSVEQREYAQTSLRSAQNLLEIVNDILDLSKIEANRLDLESIPFSVRSVVQEVLSSQALRAHEKGLELMGTVDPSVPSRVVGDPTRLRQIFNNLLSNAIKFTRQGQIELMVAQREPGLIRCSVYDTGEGIPYDRQREIFDAFTQADGSTTRRHGGTGLGLTICRQFVERMGGKIWLESQPGQGSHFSFTVKLPNYHTESHELDTPYQAFVRDLDSHQISPDDFASILQRKQVLVIDDNVTCRRALKESLAHWGIEAQVAVGPGPALQMVREAQRRRRQFDLALIDFQMPGCDGLELARELPETLAKVLLVNLGRPAPEQLAQAGICKTLVKPLLGPELAKLLLEIFQPGTEPTPAVAPPRLNEKLKILIAEDNLVNAKVVSKMLQRLGHEVVHVVNGQLAVDYLRNNQVDVVLMDVQMPVMDGFEATRRWRALETNLSYRVPIVALTGNAMASDREMCLEAGMDLHLTKPIRLDLLDQVLACLPSSRA